MSKCVSRSEFKLVEFLWSWTWWIYIYLLQRQIQILYSCTRINIVPDPASNKYCTWPGFRSVASVGAEVPEPQQPTMLKVYLNFSLNIFEYFHRKYCNIVFPSCWKKIWIINCHWFLHISNYISNWECLNHINLPYWKYWTFILYKFSHI